MADPVPGPKPAPRAPNDTDADRAPVGWGGTALSALAALFGVQSGKNHRRDAARGNPVRFVVIGLVAVVFFVLGVLLVVRLVLWQAGMDGLPA